MSKSNVQNWSFYNPVRVGFGRGCRAALLDQIRGQRVLIVTSQRGKGQLLSDPILAALKGCCVSHWLDSVTENPALEHLQGYVGDLSSLDFDAVIGFGGGSVLDSAKVLRIAADTRSQRFSLLELISNPALHPTALEKPLYLLPTTAGTGSEVTPFATVWDTLKKRKLSLAGQAMFPDRAFVDADLTEKVPWEITLATGLDAINQAAEAMWNKNANPVTLSYSMRALELGLPALSELAQQTTRDQRDAMSEASLLAGLAISHTRTAICHSISYPLTAYFGISHGLACAFTMPAVLRYNLKADDGRFLMWTRRWLGTSELAKLIAIFDELHCKLKVRERVKAKIPNLRELLALKEEMLTKGRADNNLRPIDDITPILLEAWGS